MHEMSLAESIRGIVEQQCRLHGFSRVTLLRLEIGRFAAVERAALEFALDVTMRGGPAEGARLDIVDLPGTALCRDCGQVVEVADRLDPCPVCGGGMLLPRGGTEMRVKHLEVV